MIKGETVILINTVNAGEDPFGAPVVKEQVLSVDNVLVGSPDTAAAVEELNITGKRIAYVLGIPKEDTNNWKDKKVIIRGETYRTFGFPLTQTPENVPGRWNTQVKVERYE